MGDVIWDGGGVGQQVGQEKGGGGQEKALELMYACASSPRRYSQEQEIGHNPPVP